MIYKKQKKKNYESLSLYPKLLKNWNFASSWNFFNIEKRNTIKVDDDDK